VQQIDIILDISLDSTRVFLRIAAVKWEKIRRVPHPGFTVRSFAVAHHPINPSVRSWNVHSNWSSPFAWCEKPFAWSART
jgi:hypothetical protein